MELATPPVIDDPTGHQGAPLSHASAPPNETVVELIMRAAQFARRPALKLPPPIQWLPFVLRMTLIDCVLRVGTIWLVLAGQAILGGAEYAGFDAEGGIEGVNPLALILLAVILAPLLEETAMRLLIHPFDDRRFWVSVSVWSAFIAMNGLAAPSLLILGVLPLVLILWRLFSVGGEKVSGVSRAHRSWNTHPARVVWYCTIGFALMHVANYSLPINNWRLIAVFLLVVPQLVGGLLITYTRVRTNIWGAMLHHGLSNLAFVFLVLLAT